MRLMLLDWFSNWWEKVKTTDPSQVLPHTDRQRKDSQLNSNLSVLLFKIMHAWFDANLIYIFSSFPGEM